MKKPTITIARVWYDKNSKKLAKYMDYKIVGNKNSPAGTLKEWRKWAKGKVILKVNKKRLWVE